MARLRIVLPALRDRCGSGVLASHGEILFGPFRVLGTASRVVSRRHGNPGHDRALPFGDPPTGGYVVTRVVPPGKPQPRFPRLGRAGAIVLAPTDRAVQRTRVFLQGGTLDDEGRLRRTRGGFRVADADLAALLGAIERARAAGDPLSAVEVIDVAAGFEAEPPLRRATRGRRCGPAGALPRLAGLAMALFGVTRGTFTRRRFLAQTLGVIAGAVVLDGCATNGPCSRSCESIGGSAGGEGACGRGSGSNRGSGSGSNRGSGSGR